MRRHVILKARYIPAIDFDQIQQNSAQDLVYSLDFRNIIVSYYDDQPQFIFDITKDDIGLPEYTDEEIRDIVKSKKWTLRS